MFFKALTVAAAIAGAAAQTPSGTSICDYYTTALLKNNTAANQKAVLTLVVNTAVIGNYSGPTKTNRSVAGILAPGTYDGVAVNLLPYFNGALASSNRGGMAGVSVNFLDDGGAAPLMLNMPANGTTSNQYRLLTHLYEYFGGLLGCSMMGTADYPAYSGVYSQYAVHKFMVLSAAEVGYFITQVAESAASFGVGEADLAVVGKALTNTFDMKCSPPAEVIPGNGTQLQAICTGANCTLAANAVCAQYGNYSTPASVTATTPSTTSPTSSSTPVRTGAAAAVGISFGAAFAGLAALFL